MIHYIDIAKEMCQNGIDVPSSVVLPIIEHTEALESRLALIERLAWEALDALQFEDLSKNVDLRESRENLRKSLRRIV